MFCLKQSWQIILARTKRSAKISSKLGKKLKNFLKIKFVQWVKFLNSNLTRAVRIISRLRKITILNKVSEIESLNPSMFERKRKSENSTDYANCVESPKSCGTFIKIWTLVVTGQDLKINLAKLVNTSWLITLVIQKRPKTISSNSPQLLHISELHISVLRNSDTVIWKFNELVFYH